MVLMVEAEGGMGGNYWDDDESDNEDYEDVTKVYVRGGREGIQSIKFEYVKSGQTIVGQNHGGSDPRGFIQTFEINHETHEYLVSVEGYYNNSTGVIQSIQFRTNMKTSDLMGFDEGTKFSLRASGKKIIGFHGFSGNNLNSLGAYFIKIPSIKSAIQGGTTTRKSFDDGGDFDGIRKVYVVVNGNAVRYIKFDYDKAGQVETREHGVGSGILYEFTVNHPNEYLTSVDVTYDFSSYNGCNALTSIVFKTSKGRISPLIGTEAGKKFVLESKGSAIVGFHGWEDYSCVTALGAYYNPIPPSPVLENSLDENSNQYTTLKVEGKGGMGGRQWDDGSDYEGVTKVHVRGSLEGIQFIKFEYAKAGKTIVGPIHGVLARDGLTQTFEINHATNEYLLSMEGYYNESTGVIQSVQFRTNMKTSDLMGYDEGTKFSLSASKRKIIGFHGFAEKNLNSLGAYFIKIPSIKSAIQGGTTRGTGFDDGGDFDGIRKVYVTHGHNVFNHIKFDYDKAGQVETREHGLKSGTIYEFTINHPKEYLASVEVTYTYGHEGLNSFVFKTSKGRTSPLIGIEAGQKFVLECKGMAIVGFHGRANYFVYGIGAYYNLIPPSPLEYSLDEDFNKYKKVLKVEAKGRKGGSEWDDGSDYENITKIQVRSGLKEWLRSGLIGIQSIKCDYAKDGKTFLGLIHGVPIVGSLTQTFEINHAANEYLLSVEGYYNESTSVIQSLKFKTNTKTSELMGYEEGTKFSLRASGRKIIGFHGFANDKLINSLGAYFIKIPSIKSAIQGGTTTGIGFDDGGDFDGVKKVYVTYDEYAKCVRQIKFDYNKDGQVETREHGVKLGTVYEFVVDHPNEYLTSVEVTYSFDQAYDFDFLNSFVFKTSNGRTSPLIGRVDDDKKFVLESKGSAIVGFHGMTGSCVHGLGAYYNPIPPPP